MLCDCKKLGWLTFNLDLKNELEMSETSQSDIEKIIHIIDTLEYCE